MSLGTTSKTPMEELNPLRDGESATPLAEASLSDLERRCTHALLTVLPQLRQLIRLQPYPHTEIVCPG